MNLSKRELERRGLPIPLVNPPNFLEYLLLNNKEKDEPLEVYVNSVGELSLTPLHEPERLIVFGADAVLSLLVYLQECRETIALQAKRGG
jgi:hypothetical protein